MSTVQALVVWVLLASIAWSVWGMLFTGRLPAGQPEDERDERWYRVFLGVLLFVCGVIFFVLVPDFVTRVLAAAIATGSVLLIASAFVPRLRRLRRQDPN